MHSYRKSTGGGLKLLSPQDGLCYHSGCFRLGFSFYGVFYDYCGLDDPYIINGTNVMTISKIALTTIGSIEPRGWVEKR